MRTLGMLIMILLYRGESFDANFFYHSGVDIDHSFFLQSGRSRTLLVPKMNEGLARAGFRGRVVAYDDPFKSLKKLLGGRTVFCDSSSISLRMGTRLGGMCKLEDHSLELMRMRAKKKPAEVGEIRKAVRTTKEILSSLDFRSARTELDLQNQLLVLSAEKGVEQAFDPIVASGPGTSFPHYRAGRRRLGPLVLIDFGVRWNHYCSDLTRMFILDGDRKKKEQYESLRGICHSIVDELPALGSGKEVAELSARLIARAGFPKLIHAIGHGVGLDIHEYPTLGARSAEPVHGSVLAIEPAFYFSGRYGMRFEETVWAGGKKARIL
jgi:Xaa-Pro aminopeptidase